MNRGDGLHNWKTFTLAPAAVQALVAVWQQPPWAGWRPIYTLTGADNMVETNLPRWLLRLLCRQAGLPCPRTWGRATEPTLGRAQGHNPAHPEGQDA